ncbi:MAG TPA: MFS transporter, partial [Coriobacteriia bacterium]|nr:MFS transporter [Coriobacteriia bacterium]
MKKGAAVRFLISDALSLIGNSVAAVVLPLLILARTGDPLAAGTLSLACAIPQALMGVLGGVVLDKINRRLVSVVSDCISALSVALLLVVDLTLGLNLGWFIALGILGAIGDIPGVTARETLSPSVAKHSGVDLQRFIGIEQSLQSLSVVIGPAVAALLIGFTGGTWALAVTAALSLGAALVTLTLPRTI